MQKIGGASCTLYYAKIKLSMVVSLELSLKLYHIIRVSPKPCLLYMIWEYYVTMAL